MLLPIDPCSPSTGRHRPGNGRDADRCAATTALPVTPDYFCGWLAIAMPGSSTVYHRGHLGRDRCRSTTTLSERDRQMLIALARQAMLAAAGGRVHLVQQRHGDGDYSYIAVKKSHRERHRSHPARPIPRSWLAAQHADARSLVTSDCRVPTQPVPEVANGS